MGDNLLSSTKNSGNTNLYRLLSRLHARLCVILPSISDTMLMPTSDCGNVAKLCCEICNVVSVNLDNPSPQLRGYALAGYWVVQFVLGLRIPRAEVTAFLKSEPKRFRSGANITLRGNNQMFVCSEDGRREMLCNRAAPAEWERFMVGLKGSSIVSLMGSNKRFVSVDGNGSVRCNSETIRNSELFVMKYETENMISLQSVSNGKFLCSNNGASAMKCDRDKVDAWERFVVNQLTVDDTLKHAYGFLNGLRGAIADKNSDLYNDVEEICSVLDVMNIDQLQSFTSQGWGS